MTRVLYCAAAIVLAAAIVAVSPRLTAQATPQKGWDVAAELGPAAKLAVIPKGPYVLPYVMGA